MSVLSPLVEGRAAAVQLCQPSGLIDVRKLVWIVLYDDFDRHGNLVTRFIGHGVEPMPGGIRLGGASNCRFEKHLQLPPGNAAPGLRFDLDNPKILDLALQIDRTLDRHCQFTRFPRRHHPGLPTFWAAFESDAALSTDFQSRRLQANAANQTPEMCRQHCGYHLRPLASDRNRMARQIREACFQSTDHKLSFGNGDAPSSTSQCFAATFNRSFGFDFSPGDH